MMKKKNEESNNDVNEFPDSSHQNLTFSSWGLTLQDPLDRQSATAVNAKTFQNKIQHIATWNICTLHHKGKLDNVMLEINRMRISCLGLCEVRWTGNGQFEKDDKTIIYSGRCGHNNGVALIMDKTFAKSILSYLPKSDRLLFVKLKASPFNINLIVAYAPTAEADESVLETFYETLDDLYKNCKSQEINMLLGNFNAKVGSGKQRKTVEPHGLGTRNERGERLVDWCEEKKLVITNTWFETHPKRKYTWISPGD